MAADPHVLLHLVDRGQIDHLLSIVTIDEVAQAWVDHGRREHPLGEAAGDDPQWWAIELWWKAEWLSNGDRVRSGLLALVDAAVTDHELGRVGAGPLENFVSDDSDDLRWLEQQCSKNAKLRTALSGVWCSNFVSSDTLMRLDRAAGVPLARLASG